MATAFGAFLDPVADKIMVATALVLLATDPPSPISQQQMVVLVLVIICRELTMSALREWAASRGKSARKVCWPFWKSDLCSSVGGLSALATSLDSAREQREGLNKDMLCAIESIMRNKPWAHIVQAVKVNSLGKWKTALQMVAMSAMLAVRRADSWLGDSALGMATICCLIVCQVRLLCHLPCARVQSLSSAVSHLGLQQSDLGLVCHTAAGMPETA